MRATRAYITGFGTTGLLIASALLTLCVTSAFVAFNGFPGQDVQDPIGTLLLQQRQAPVEVPAKPAQVKGVSGTKAAVATSHRTRSTHSQAPAASTGPVAQRSPAQAPTQAPPLSSSQGVTSVTQTTTPAIPPDTSPQVPDASLPQVPGVTVPSVPPPPGDSQLPVDTSGITNLLGGG